MHTLPTTGVSYGGSIAAEVSLGEVLLRNSLAIADDKENLLQIPNKHKDGLKQEAKPCCSKDVPEAVTLHMAEVMTL